MTFIGIHIWIHLFTLLRIRKNHLACNDGKSLLLLDSFKPFYKEGTLVP